MCSRKANARNTSAVLFGRTRQAVLSLLFDQPQRSFFVREISRYTGVSPGALQKELVQLHGADLLVRIRRGNQVHYQANYRHPVFPELQALIRKTCGIPILLTKALQELEGNLTFAAIYGSYARGGLGAESDIDLLLVGDVTLEKAIESVCPLEARIDREISIRVLSSEELRTKQGMGDPFISGILNGPYIPLLGDLKNA